jgi:hypothetical protein
MGFAMQSDSPTRAAHSCAYLTLLGVSTEKPGLFGIADGVANFLLA